jgi:hypothetical protein
MKHVKLKPNETTVDHRYQRELDAKRVEAMVRSYDPNLVGVPVVSRREDGSLVRIDGQHRMAAAIAAGHGDTPHLMEVHDGLSIQDEAKLFLRLNGGRTAVGAIDKYKARLEAREPTALEMCSVLKKLGCKITRAPQKGGIMAVQSVESAYHRGNLESTMRVLVTWLDGSPEAFDGKLIRGVSEFLSAFPEAEPMHLASRLDAYSPSRLLSKIRRESQNLGSAAEVARVIFAEIYNFRTTKTRRVGRIVTDVSAAAE